MSYFNCHSHTHYSNIRLLDCINRPKDLIKKAYELGLSGIAITDHECVSAWMEVNKFAKEFREEHPEFTIALGNEIYLTNTRDKGQKYYHFILIAKDTIGAKAIRELSSTAWYNCYIDRNMERVPTLKSELETIVNKYGKGHIIATTACIGGELGTSIQKLEEAELNNNIEQRNFWYQNIVNFIQFCIKVFGEDFYIECAPSAFSDQILVNKRALKIARYFNIKVVVGTDAHYLTKEDRYIHEAYLNSKGGEREVASFYSFARLMDNEECYSLLTKSYSEEEVNEIFKNSLEVQNKITFFSLEKK